MFVNNIRSAVSQIKYRNKISIWRSNIIRWVSYICNVYTEWTGKCDWVCTQVKTDKSCVSIGMWQNVYSALTLDALKTPLSQLLLLGSVTQLCLHLGDYRNTGFWISSASLPFLSCLLLSVPLSIFLYLHGQVPDFIIGFASQGEVSLVIVVEFGDTPKEFFFHGLVWTTTTGLKDLSLTFSWHFLIQCLQSLFLCKWIHRTADSLQVQIRGFVLQHIALDTNFVKQKPMGHNNYYGSPEWTALKA